MTRGDPYTDVLLEGIRSRMGAALEIVRRMREDSANLELSIGRYETL